MSIAAPSALLSSGWRFGPSEPLCRERLPNRRELRRSRARVASSPHRNVCQQAIGANNRHALRNRLVDAALAQIALELCEGRRRAKRIGRFIRVGHEDVEEGHPILQTESPIVDSPRIVSRELQVDPFDQTLVLIGAFGLCSVLNQALHFSCTLLWNLELICNSDIT